VNETHNICSICGADVLDVNCTNCEYPQNGSLRDQVKFKNKLTEIYYTFKSVKRYKAGLHYVLSGTMVFCAVNALPYNLSIAAVYLLLAIGYLVFGRYFKPDQWSAHFTYLSITVLGQTVGEFIGEIYPLYFFDQYTVESMDELDIVPALMSFIPLVYWVFRGILVILCLRASYLSNKLQMTRPLYRLANSFSAVAGLEWVLKFRNGEMMSVGIQRHFTDYSDKRTDVPGGATSLRVGYSFGGVSDKDWQLEKLRFDPWEHKLPE